jgi:hypothetical protein
MWSIIPRLLQIAKQQICGLRNFYILGDTLWVYGFAICGPNLFAICRLAFGDLIFGEHKMSATPHIHNLSIQK